MTLSNIKSNNRGFTIVELLIVIVIIAILAAITIVAYNGIQDRAKDSSASSLANNVAKKVDIYYTTNSVYPTLSELTSNTGTNGKESVLDTNTKNALQAADPTDEKKVGYQRCGTTGAKVNYWQKSGNVTKYLGDATSTTTGCA